MHVANLCLRASLYSYFQHPANLSTPTWPACISVASTSSLSSIGLLLVSSLSSAVRAALGGSPRARFDRGIPPCNLTISASSSSLLGGCRRQKEKGTVYAQRKAGFSNKPAGGPFPSRRFRSPPALGGPPATTTVAAYLLVF